MERGLVNHNDCRVLVSLESLVQVLLVSVARMLFLRRELLFFRSVKPMEKCWLKTIVSEDVGLYLLLNALLRSFAGRDDLIVMRCCVRVLRSVVFLGLAGSSGH